ncbi:MAG: hypothetical protein JXB06_03580 [Spirochaetales bacterium]|nr:hypothetical protein [Spirochaetales bacterium]
MRVSKKIPALVPAALAALALLLPAAAVSAQQNPDISSLIGLNLEEAFERLGAPAQVYVLRGTEPEQDDVVFYYSSHLYLFWYGNRVWQVRTDRRYPGQVFSLYMGDPREQVIETLGRPILELEDCLVFHVEDRGYPVQARLYFEDGALSDLYCFRGDL